MLKNFYLFLSFLLIFNNIFCEPYSIGHLGRDKGLSHSVVNSITQDTLGFLWFATQNGLNRFDGYSIKYYDANNKSGLLSNNIKCVFVDRNGILWVGSDKGGVYKYCYKNDIFKPYIHISSDKNTISSNDIYSICDDNKGNIWLGTFGGGVNCLNPYTGSVKHYISIKNDTNTLSSNYIRSIIASDDGYIYIGTDDSGLDILDTHTGQIKKIKHRPHVKNTLSNNVVMALFIDKYNYLWIGTYGGALQKYDLQNNIFTNYFHSHKDNPLISNSIIWSISKGISDNHIFVATRGGGVDLINIQTNQIEHIYHTIENRNGLISNNILTIYHDKSGITWIGTEGEGINFLNKKSEIFKRYPFPLHIADYLNKFNISAICENDNYLWFGTRNNGYIQYNKAKGTLLHIRKSPNGLNNNNVISIIVTKNEHVWLGTDGGGVNIMNTQGKLVKQITENSINPNLTNDAVHCLYLDKEDNVWIGTWGGGLCKYVSGENKIINYTVDTIKMNNVVRCIYKDDLDRVWFGTDNKGLGLLLPGKEKIIFYNKIPYDDNSISSSSVLNIKPSDFSDYLWIATNGGGLCKFQISTGIFTKFNTHNGLADNIVMAIEKDNNNMLYVTTDNGFSIYNIKDNTFKTYRI
ncbi:MAG: two-component regulator propeller domain-containing protein, partial [Bacteroidales bacterium]